MTNDISDEADISVFAERDAWWRSVVEAAVLAERKRVIEECARIVETNMIFAPKSIGRDHGKHHEAGAQHAQRVFAAAIRALGEKPTQALGFSPSACVGPDGKPLVRDDPSRIAWKQGYAAGLKAAREGAGKVELESSDE